DSLRPRADPRARGARARLGRSRLLRVRRLARRPDARGLPAERSMSEQRHIVSAFAFELGKVETRALRRRMLGGVALVERELCRRAGGALAMEGEAESLEPARPAVELKTSPSLSLVRKAKPSLAERARARGAHRAARGRCRGHVRRATRNRART